MSDLRQNLDRLKLQKPKQGELEAKPPADPVAAQRGTGYRADAGDQGTGVSSPLTEQSRVEKQLTIPVPSGVTTVEFNYISSVEFRDGEGRAIVLNYNDSTPPEPPP